MFASVSVRACVSDVFAIYDNDILPRLIIIIITIIILYFIQIRHTDDFPQTGTRLVYTNAPMLTDGINAPLPIQPDYSNSNDAPGVATIPPHDLSWTKLV